MVYARYSQGFRSGGFSNRGNDPAFSRSPRRMPTHTKSAPRTSSSIIRLQFNLTGFYTIVQDAQFNSILTTTGVPPGTNTIVNNALR